jgi:hypothetical protein
MYSGANVCNSFWQKLSKNKHTLSPAIRRLRNAPSAGLFIARVIRPRMTDVFLPTL